MGRALIFIGAVLFLIGIVLIGVGRIPGPGGLGRLPGDVYIQRRNFSFYFPLTTGLLISVLLSLLFWFLNRR